ncbi:ATP-binding protein [Haloimpatiens sp. FM7315]|uniref:ATP-binding protein n=1 Tax=Haloimpatiens sp. FM7315 TaxID=3298609 RepID=UPI00370BC8A2
MELAVLSGKGGTGKTTIAIALSELSKGSMRIDCDVDAPNLYLFYRGKDKEREAFFGGKKAYIDKAFCIMCGKCKSICKFDAIDNYKVNSFSCEGCGACVIVCENNAIKLISEKTADTVITSLEKGIISRAEMMVGSDGSGKLITSLRKNAKKFSDNEKIIIIDGSPGIGCPVIASITGTNAVLIVAEPTKSGLEDLKRVLSLCEHFGVLTMVCINKYDINLEISSEIEEYVLNKNLFLAGRIPYDDMVRRSINELNPITNYNESQAKKAIEDMWLNIKNKLKI